MDGDPSVSVFNKQLGNLEAKLRSLMKLLNRLSNSINFSHFKEETSGIEYAKFCSSLAFVLCSLDHVKSKLDGNNVTTHKISNHLTRIKSYMKEINDIQTEKNSRSRVDKHAARRIINSST